MTKMNYVEGVEHPSYYNDGLFGLECIDVIEYLNYNLGSAVKYIWRAGKKPGTTAMQDLQKAFFLVERQKEGMKDGSLLRSEYSGPHLWYGKTQDYRMNAIFYITKGSLDAALLQIGRMILSEQRKPPHPVRLMDALQDRPDIPASNARTVKALKVKTVKT